MLRCPQLNKFHKNKFAVQEFKPERFAADQVKDIDPFAFVAFSAGPRYATFFFCCCFLKLFKLSVIKREKAICCGLLIIRLIKLSQKGILSAETALGNSLQCVK